MPGIIVPIKRRVVKINAGIVRVLKIRRGILRSIAPVMRPIARLKSCRLGKKNISPYFWAAGILDAVKIKTRPIIDRMSAHIINDKLNCLWFDFNPKIRVS